MEDDGDRRNSPPLPSTYVTLVQLQQRWLQEKQRKQKEEEEREEQERKQKIQKEQEDEEKRKRREGEEQLRKQKQANLQKRPVQSTATFHRRDHRPPLKSSAQFRAVGVSDGESKRTDDLKQKKEGYNEGKNWKMKGKPRAEEDPSGGKEQLLPEEKEDVVDKIPVVSTERDYSEKERVTSNWKKLENNKRGKARVEEDLAIGREHLSLEKEDEADENVVPEVSTERRRCGKEIGGKCEEGISASGGKRGNGRDHRGVKNRGNNKRVEEEDLITIGREEKLPKKEVEAAENVVPEVSTERRCGKEIGGKCEEGVSASGGKRGNGRDRRGVKNRGNNKRVEEEDLITIGREEKLPKKEVEAAENVVPVVSTERRRCEKEIGGKCEEGVSAGGGKRGYGRCPKGLKNRGNNKRVEEEDLITIGREEVEAENVVVEVSTEREGGGLEEGNGKNLVVNGSRVWQERVGGTVVDWSERVLGKFEGISVRGGYGRNAGNVNGAPRRNGWGNSRRLQRPRDSNLVWVRKEEGDTSDVNVAGV
ncbi:hypothetical protein RHGRI_016423 [Rhododendron griersonianum]|uniref:Uncharacterized protein n=1 Tax=Rhododendron griersonianum TaxID=479676 RepID=A0AAV6JU33_9ERIC|nr:hypothetical protein RHGRI_016423 [Rhododendron griersonianum]